jgi:hypothetical protein
MNTLSPTALRQLVLKVLAEDAGPAGGAEALAAATRRAYDDLARVSIRLIGRVGVEALTGRAVHLAQREHSWLQHGPGASEDTHEPFAKVIVCLARQDPVVAMEGAAVVFTTFVGLLISFIGEPLTTGLLREAWPTAFSATPTEET